MPSDGKHVGQEIGSRNKKRPEMSALLSDFAESQLFGLKGQKCHHSCSLDCLSKRSLMFDADAGHAAGDNFSFFGDVAGTLFSVFVITFIAFLNLSCESNVINLFDFVDTERAYFLSGCVPAGAGGAGQRGGFRFFHHINSP
jgi:hypothetical protein